MLKYVKRLALYFLIFLLTFSVFSVLFLRFVPVTVTPLKVVRLSEKRDGERPGVEARWKPLDRISPELVQAVVATEDNHFLKHNGFDMEAIRKAREENKQGRRLRGGEYDLPADGEERLLLPGPDVDQKGHGNVFYVPHRVVLEQGADHGGLPQRDRNP